MALASPTATDSPIHCPLLASTHGAVRLATDPGGTVWYSVRVEWANRRAKVVAECRWWWCGERGARSEGRGASTALQYCRRGHAQQHGLPTTLYLPCTHTSTARQQRPRALKQHQALVGNGLVPVRGLIPIPHTEFVQPIMSPKQTARLCSRTKHRNHKRVFRNVEMPSQRRAALCRSSPSSSWSDWRVHNVTGTAQKWKTQVGLGLSSATGRNRLLQPL
jgi:hypothetical protein